jgi:hypothetical protein
MNVPSRFLFQRIIGRRVRSLRSFNFCYTRMEVPSWLIEEYKAVMRKGTNEELYNEIDNLKRDPNPVARSRLVPAVEEILREREVIDSRRNDEIGFGFMTPEQKVAYRAKMAARRLERAFAAAEKRDHK